METVLPPPARPGGSGVTGWIVLAAVTTFTTLLGWCIWGRVTDWYTPVVSVECKGCQRHFVRAGCPVHDDQLRKVA